MNTEIKRLVAVVGVLALVAAGCSRGSDPAAVGTLTPLEGGVEIARGEADWQTVDEPVELAPGDQVRSDSTGAARLQLSDLGAIEIGPSSRVRMGSGGHAELLSGGVLAEGRGLTVDVGKAQITPRDEAAFRVDRSLSTRVGVYRGAAVVEALGAPRVVEALWETVLLAHAVPTAPVPLNVAVRHPWDRRMLGDAIDVGRGLFSLERAARPRVNAQPEPSAAIARAVGRVSPSSVDRLLEEHEVSRSQLFVSLALARHASPRVVPTAGSILTRVELGASWIVVVAGLEIARPSLLGAIARVLASIPALGAGETAAGTPDGSPSPGGSEPSPSPTSSPSPPCDSPPCDGGEEPTPCPPDDQACEFQQQVDDLLGPVSDDRDDDPGDIPPLP